MTKIITTQFFRSTIQDTPREALEPLAIRLALDWRGPGNAPHRYWPDYHAMGDCSVCGYMREDHPEGSR